jgi:regulator of RNase E activity RraA
LAVTVKEQSGVRGTYKAEELAVADVLDAAQPGSVLMFDLGGAAVSTFGGLAARAAVQRQVHGLVIDGGCRDVEEIRAAGLWAATRHVTPMSGRGRVAVKGINVPVSICGTIVNAGDFIYGDETGIVCVPRDRFDEVLAIARQLAQQDGRFFEALNRGETFGAVSRRLNHL